MRATFGLFLWAVVCLSQALDAQTTNDCCSSSGGSEVNIYTELRELRALVVELSAKLTTTQNELKEQKVIVSELKTAMHEQPKIAFSAGMLTSENRDYGIFSSETNIVFGKVLTNVGNAYNADTGVFTAPVRGVYYFRFTGNGRGGQDMGLSIFKGASRMMSVYEYKSTGEYNDHASNGVTLQLEVGETVYMRLWVNTWVYTDRRYDYTSFSGFLLFPL